jgi:fumarate hydratase class II
LQSIRLLADACRSFAEHCIAGLKADRVRIDAQMRNSLMLVTALAPHIGYDNAAKIARHAHRKGCTLKTAALALGLLNAAEFDRWVDPSAMIGPRKPLPRRRARRTER